MLKLTTLLAASAALAFGAGRFRTTLKGRGFPKPQSSLAFVPLNSNGRDVLKGAQAPAGVTRR